MLFFFKPSSKILDKREVRLESLNKGGGGCPRLVPPYGPKISQFHAVLGNFDKIVCWHPPGGSAPPPTGNPGSAPDNKAKNALN